MLIEFRVENFRSLREEQVLTFEADSGATEDDSRPRESLEGSKPLLPVTAIYGANASGKSNVLAAIDFMRFAVSDSQGSWPPDEGIPREPFAWGPKKTEPSLFEITMIVDSVRYQYGFLANDEAFLEEWLYAWPNGKKQIWFEREGSEPIKIGENLKGENRVIEEITRPNSLFLSAAAQNKHGQLSPIYAWFREIQSFNIKSSIGLGSSWTGPFSSHIIGRMLEQSTQKGKSISENLREQFRLMLRNADVGIVDVRVEREESDNSLRRLKRTRFFLKHEGPYEDGWLPLEAESSGTKTLFKIAIPMLKILRDGGVLIVDELEASLHPNLAQRIVELFNDPKSNPKNGQLLFCTHDTNLLGTTTGKAALRRDQVWLTEKNREGATELYPLTDYKPRTNENLERGYLQGRYGAIPFLGNFSPLSE